MTKQHTKDMISQSTETVEFWQTFITRVMEDETEELLQIVNSDPLLKDAKAPERIGEKLWKQIREYENVHSCEKDC